MPTRNIADRHARLQRLLHDSELLLGREPPPAGNTGNYSHLRKCLGHRRMPRTMPPAIAGVRSKRGAVQPGCFMSEAELQLPRHSLQ